MIEKKGDLKMLGITFQTALHNFCDTKKISSATIKLFYDNKSDLNFKNEDGETPLLRALKNEYLSSKSIEFLVDNKAEVNVLNKSQKTSANYFLENKKFSTKIWQNLVEFFDTKNFQSFIQICMVKNEEKKNVYSTRYLQFMIEKKSDLSFYFPNLEKKKKKTTFLNFLCSQNFISTDVLEFLSDFKCNLTILDDQQNNPLHFVCDNPLVSLDIIQFLYNRGCSLNHKNNDGKTPQTILKNLNDTIKKFEEEEIEKIENLIDK